jgi:hypothetical protein
MNEQNTVDDFSLLRQVPAIVRARAFRLYTQNGKRLVDLWQNGGAAVLGHTPPLVLRELKNTASRGLFSPFPHFLEARYLKALARLFPGRTCTLYASPPPALEALLKTGAAALWRPFQNEKNPLAVPPDAPQALVPVLPGIHLWRGNLPQGLCVLARAGESATPFPAGDVLSPVLLAAAARGVYDLLAAAPQRANPAYPRVLKALRESPWRRQGIYLSLRESPGMETWAALFRRFLDAGFLLPPYPAHPVILPGELSPGEEAHLAALLP